MRSVGPQIDWRVRRRLDDLLESVRLPDAHAGALLLLADPLARDTEREAAIEALPQVVSALQGVLPVWRDQLAQTDDGAIRNQVVIDAVRTVFFSPDDPLTDSPMHRALWRHLQAVGEVVRQLAVYFEVTDPYPEDLALAGWIHDIGVLLAESGWPQPFQRILETLPPKASLVEAERAAWGMDHAVLGACLARRWQLPETVARLVRHHHAAAYSGRGSRALACLQLANFLCSVRGLKWRENGTTPISTSAFEVLELDADGLRQVVADLEPVLARQCFPRIPAA